MSKQTKSFVILLFSFLVLSACGQKGPLYLPGDPSQIRSIPAEQPAPTREDDEDDEEEATTTIN